jgi:general secretion pathway protein C
MPNIDPATGKMKGYLLSGVDAKSPVRDLGLEQGDKLMAANDIIFDDAAKGFLAFNTLKDATKIVLSIERKKKPLKIEYELR